MINSIYWGFKAAEMIDEVHSKILVLFKKVIVDKNSLKVVLLKRSKLIFLKRIDKINNFFLIITSPCNSLE
jgi:hypothetical protein